MDALIEITYRAVQGEYLDRFYRKTYVVRLMKYYKNI